MSVAEEEGTRDKDGRLFIGEIVQKPFSKQANGQMTEGHVRARTQFFISSDVQGE